MHLDGFHFRFIVTVSFFGLCDGGSFGGEISQVAERFGKTRYITPGQQKPPDQGRSVAVAKLPFAWPQQHLHKNKQTLPALRPQAPSCLLLFRQHRLILLCPCCYIREKV